MFKNSGKAYKFTLPTSTSKEIVEWFEDMENSHLLAEALVELVHDNIKSGGNMKANGNPCEIVTAKPQIEHEKGNDSEFFETIYNWQESNNEIFSDKERNQKKKMLSV